MADDVLKIDVVLDKKTFNAQSAELNRQVLKLKSDFAKGAKIQVEINIAKLQSQLDLARKELAKFKKEGDRTSEINARLKINNLQKNIAVARKELSSLDSVASKTGRSFFSLNGIVGDALKVFGGFYILNQMKQAFLGLVSVSLSFETAFAGVRKTVEAAPEQLDKLEDSFKRLTRTIPVSFEELSRIGELGGQLGISIEGLEQFTKTIAALAVTTNLTAESASLDLARIVNVLGLSESEVSNLGSSIVDLGNKFATTEQEIVTFATRISGTGNVVGLTAGDITGIATAFTSVGVEAEAGGTAVQTVLLEMNSATLKGGKTLTQFAKVAGLSSKEFKEVWERDAGRAFQLFVEGLSGAGSQADVILTELVGDNTRLKRGFLSLASAEGLLAEAMRTGNTAFIENNALIEEANKRYATNESRLEIVKNKWKLLAVTIGDSINNVLVPALEAITQFAEEFEKGSGAGGRFKDTVSAIIDVITVLVGASVGIKLVAFFTTFTTAITAAGGATAVLATEMWALEAAILAVPTAVIIAVSALGLGAVISKFNELQSLITGAQQANKASEELIKDRIKDRQSTLDNIDKEREHLKDLSGDKKKDKETQLNLIAAEQGALKTKEGIELDILALQERKAKLGKGVLGTLKNIVGLNERERDSLDKGTKKLEENRKKQLAIVYEVQGRFSEKTDAFKEELKTLYKIEGVVKDLKDDKDIGGFGGAGEKELKDAEKEAEKAIKKIQDALEAYDKRVQAVNKSTEELAKDTAKFYEGIEDSINKAKDTQDELQNSLEKFIETTNKEAGEEQTALSGELAEDLAKKQVELEEDSKKILEEKQKILEDIKKIEGTQTETQQEVTDRQKNLDAAKKEQRDILEEEKANKEELANIKAFFEKTADDSQRKLFQETLDFINKSETEQLIELSEKKSKEIEKNKNEAIAAEEAKAKAAIDAQQRIINVQQSLKDAFTGEDKKGRLEIGRIAAADEGSQQELLNQFIKDQFQKRLTDEEKAVFKTPEEDLTEEQKKIKEGLDARFAQEEEFYDREAKAELLAQITKTTNLNQELVDITAQQKEILSVKEEYIKLAEDIFNKSVDAQKIKIQELIAEIQKAQTQQLILNSLRGTSSSEPTGGTINNTKTNNITQNIYNPMDLEVGIQKILRDKK